MSGGLSAAAARRSSSRSGRWPRTSASTRSRSGCSATPRRSRAVERALDLVGDVPVVLDPVMVAESGARLLDEDAEARAASAAAAARHGRHAEPAGGARAGGAWRRRPSRAELARAVSTRSGPAASSSPAATASRRSTCSSTASGSSSFPGERYPERRRARLRLHPLVGAGRPPGARPGAARGGQQAKRIASEAVRDGLRGLGAGAGPVDVLGLGGPGARAPRPARPASAQRARPVARGTRLGRRAAAAARGDRRSPSGGRPGTWRPRPS